MPPNELFTEILEKVLEILDCTLTTANNRLPTVTVDESTDSREEHVPVESKLTLTVSEASEYSNIGRGILIKLLKTPNCPFALFIGTKMLIKRREFEQFISTATQLKS